MNSQVQPALASAALPPADPALVVRAAELLALLAGTIGARPTGSAANARAVDWFAATAAATGLHVMRDEFPALDWQEQGASLTAADGTDFAVFPSPYSPALDLWAPLLVISSVEDLETQAQAGGAQGRLLLLRGAAAGEQLFPRNYPFVSFDEHQRIYQALDAAQPAGLITATAPSPMAGALYPLPMFEDGDFDTPSVYLSMEEGERLAALAVLENGRDLHLQIRSQRLPVTAANVVVGSGDGPPAIVVLAHIDSKPTTPGALDNGGGVVTLLLLAELLRESAPKRPVELVAINGEDHYSAAGEQAFLRRLGDRFGALALGINIDGIGFVDGATAFSLYNMGADGPHAQLGDRLRALLAAQPDMVEGADWIQSDHAMFVMAGLPALAFTSSALDTLFASIWHTAQDTPVQVNPQRLAEVARALREVVLHTL